MFFRTLNRINPVKLTRSFAQISGGTGNKVSSTSSGAGSGSSSSTAKTGINENVPGLSNRVVRPITGPVGPGASPTGEYKVPEYYCYNNISYYEAEIEMAKYRCPQPSALN